MLTLIAIVVGAMLLMGLGGMLALGLAIALPIVLIVVIAAMIFGVLSAFWPVLLVIFIVYCLAGRSSRRSI
jgi:flagellar biosynthesis protein FliR